MDKINSGERGARVRLDVRKAKPTGPVWEKAKAEPNWLTYRLVPQPGKKPLKIPQLNGRNAGADEAAAFTFDEAQAQLHGATDQQLRLGYLPRARSAMVGVDLDGIVDAGGATRANLHALIASGGYWEISPSGTGIRGLIPRPDDGDWTHDRSGEPFGYLGSPSKFFTVTFECVSQDTEVRDTGAFKVFTNEIEEAVSDRIGHEGGSGDGKGPGWFQSLSHEDKLACAEEALSALPGGWPGKDADRYHSWLYAGMGLKHSIGEAAFPLWVRHSRRWAGHDPKTDTEEELRAKWESFGRRSSCVTGARSVGTLFMFSREHGWTEAEWRERGNRAMNEQYAQAMQKLEARKVAQLGHAARSSGQAQGSGESHDPDSFDALLVRELPPIEWAVDDLVEYGTLTLMVARPKAGKGWLCLQLAEAVGSGTEYLGRRTNQGHVLYVAAEDKQDGVTRRLQLMKFSRGAKGCVLDFSAKNPAEALAWLAQYLLEHPETRLVILDTLRYFFGTREESKKNAQDQDFEMLKPLRELAVRSGVGIVAVMHERKPPGAAKPKSMDISDAMAGSMLMTGTAEATLRLLRNKSKTDQRDLPGAQLQIMGRQIKDTDTIHVRFNGDTCRFETASEEAIRLAAAIDRARSGTVRAHILEALQAAKGKLHRDDLRQRLCEQDDAFGTPSVTPGGLRETLRRLKSEGILQVDAEGYLSLPPAASH